jgi:hypothetical protein
VFLKSAADSKPGMAVLMLIKKTNTDVYYSYD